MGTLFVIDYVYFELLIIHIAAAEMKKGANNWIQKHFKQKHFKRFETIKHLRPCRGLKLFLYCAFSEATQFMMYKLMAIKGLIILGVLMASQYSFSRILFA